MPIPSTMRGLQIVEFKKPYRYSENIPTPDIQKDTDILIKIAVAGYCHTEMLAQNGDFERKMLSQGLSLPIIPSHEGCGTVVKIGSKVTKYKVGDRIGTLLFRDTCGTCINCESGIPKYCGEAKMMGIVCDGAAAEYMVADSEWVVPLPPAMKFETAAPLMCAGITVYCGLKTAGLKSGQKVAIIGVGALGHLAVQFAKCMGLTVVCVDSRQAPLDLVKNLTYAPDYALDATKGIQYALQEIGGGVDATLMTTDSIQAHEYGLRLTREHGTFVVIGQPFDPIPIHYSHLIFRNITVKGSLLGDPLMAKEMVDMVAEKGIEVKTRAYDLKDIETLMQDMHKENHAGKLVLRVSQDVQCLL